MVREKWNDKLGKKEVAGKIFAIFLECVVNPLNAKLNPIRPLLALFGAHHILHVSMLRVNVDKNQESRGLRTY
jgi:hypothetical protein